MSQLVQQASRVCYVLMESHREPHNQCPNEPGMNRQVHIHGIWDTLLLGLPVGHRQYVTVLLASLLPDHICSSKDILC